MPPIEKTDFNGDSNLGLHAEVTENFCVVNPGLSEKCYEKISRVLQVDPIKIPITGSHMSGIFCAGNSNGVALPKNTADREVEALEDEGMDCTVVEAKQTALGNLILVNESACVVSPRLEGVMDELEDCFKVPVRTAEIAGMDLLGTSAVANGNGLLSHRDTLEKEMEVLEEHFGTMCGIGTINFGSTFVGACMLANSRGALVGTDTTGPELGRIDEALFSRTD